MEFTRTIRRSKFLQILLSIILLICIYFYYKYGSATAVSGLHKNKLKVAAEMYQKSGDQDQNAELLSVLKSNVNNTDTKSNELKDDYFVDPESIDVMVTFTKAENNRKLISKFRTTVSSMLKFATVHINLYILGDEACIEIAREILDEVADKQQYTMKPLDLNELVKNVHDIISSLQSFFSYKPGAYYSDSLFFLSIVAHKVLPDLNRVIMLDCDLKFNADVRELFNFFEVFSENNIIGIAHEAQPVYRHNFHMFRNQNKGTRVGDPPPDGLAGFNSGVMLLNLDKMRESDVYNSLINAEVIKHLTEKYMFKGNLGDQDFYSLIAIEHEDLFYVLPCSWNRQLCTWWRDHGYSDVFDSYFKCDEYINIYHGNCDSPMPKLDWEST